jgi:hypothetical protein
MRFLFLFPFFLNIMLLNAQESFSEIDARQLIDTFFEGFHEGDTLKMRSVMTEIVPMQTAFVNREGFNLVSNGPITDLLNAVATRTPDQRWEERLLDYKVQIDGNLAHVWTPYEFWFNGEFSHCGANAFTLARTDSGWKIIHIIDSRRRESCRE